MSNWSTVEDDYTSFPAYKAAAIIWKVVSPILIIFGTVGNSLCIYVLTRRSIRSSTTALYLTALAFSDLAVLYSGLLRQWLVYLFDVDVRQLNEVGCKLNIWLVYCSLDFSAWILLVVTLERVISAWLPHNYRSVCTKKSALSLILAIGVFMLALNSHLLYGMVFKDITDEFGNFVSEAKCVEINASYYSFFNKSWPWVDLCVFCVIPFTVIVIGNSLILLKVVKSHKKANSAIVPNVKVNSKHRSHSSGHGKHSSMTTMLFTLNIVFLLCTSPVSIYNIGYSYWVTNASPEKVATLDLWWAIVNMLQYTNNSINFLLYCLSGSKFRNEVINLFCRKLKARNASSVARDSKYTRSRCDSESNRVRSRSNSASHHTVSSVQTPVQPLHTATDNDKNKHTYASTLHPDSALHLGDYTHSEATTVVSCV